MPAQRSQQPGPVVVTPCAVMQTTYRGPVCIEVEDGTFGNTLEGRKSPLRVARNVLRPCFA